MKNLRVGRFKLSHDFLRDDKWQELLPLMGNFVITRAESDYMSRSIEYTAYSPMFEEWPEACMIPEYEIHITLNDFGPAEIRAERIKR